MRTSLETLVNTFSVPSEQSLNSHIDCVTYIEFHCFLQVVVFCTLLRNHWYRNERISKRQSHRRVLVMELRNSMGHSFGMQELLRYKTYNSCFYPNACHVCKFAGSNKMVLCSRCGMIAYCSESHRCQHLLEHKELCEAIVKVFSKSAQQRTGKICLSIFQHSKFSMMNSVKRIFSRDLNRYEEQMFMFEKSCLICNRRDELHVCKHCFVSNYCESHQHEFRMLHKNCKELNLCFKLDTYILVQKWFFFFTVPHIQDFPNRNISIINMEDFIVQYMKRGLVLPMYETDYLYSDWISGPLTLCYGLKEAFLLPKPTNVAYTIHIINPDYIDRVNFLMWELLLHFSPHIKKLTIVVLVPMVRRNINMKCAVCLNCQESKEFFYESYPMLYQEYVASMQYKKPDVIIGFQLNFDCFRDWVDTLNVIRTQNCPLFLTVKSLSKAESITNSIKRVLRVSTLPVRIVENRFSAMRPHRDVLHSTFYRNKFLVSFETLNFPGLARRNNIYVNCHL